MKNQKLIIFFILLLVITLTAGTVFAKGKGENKEEELDWAGIFASEIQKASSYLGLKCLYNSEKQYQKSILEKEIDSDLNITNAEFIGQLQSVGIGASQYNTNVSGFKYDSKELCFITQNEYLAIRLYTGSYYRQINAALRNLDLQSLKSYKVLIKFLMSGLNKLDNFVGVTKRGSILKSELTTFCEAGNAFGDRGFMSTSVASGFSGAYRFVLASATCKYVAPISTYTQEEEVLCLPGTLFQVRYFQDGSAGKEVVLQEVEGAGQRLNIDDLIKSLEAHPETQNPNHQNYWAQSCQPAELIFGRGK
jgi:hypothetical protein